MDHTKNKIALILGLVTPLFGCDREVEDERNNEGIVITAGEREDIFSSPEQCADIAEHFREACAKHLSGEYQGLGVFTRCAEQVFSMEYDFTHFQCGDGIDCNECENVLRDVAINEGYGNVGDSCKDWYNIEHRRCRI